MSASGHVSREDQIARVSHAFTTRVGAPPAWRWFVPGRLEVFGKHTDYAGGRTLVAAVPRGFVVAAGPRGDGRVVAYDARNNQEVTVDPSVEGRVTSWATYVAAAVRRLSGNFPGAAHGLDLVFASDLPRAAGLSSSSALIIAVATALATRAELDARDEWRTHIRTLEDRATYFGCIENGQSFGALRGSAGVGTHGGSEDHMAILGGRPGWLGWYAFVPVRRLGHVLWPKTWACVIATSGVHADKAGAVREQYNRASAAARALLALWNRAASEPAPSLATALGASGAVDELRCRIEGTAVDGYTPAELRARLDHFLAEDDLVERAVTAIRHGAATLVGECAQQSQQHAERWLGNQVPETVALAGLARECGAYGGTSFGAGFGGSAWALVDAHEADAFGRAWTTAYEARHPERSPVEWFVATPGPGLHAIA